MTAPPSAAPPWGFEPVGKLKAFAPVWSSPWAGREDWFGRAIDVLGSTQARHPAAPVAVIARVVSSKPRSITPELAKRLLDTLHDRKHLPPHYRDRERAAVLADDSPQFVTALAIELRTGDVDRVDFVLADGVAVRGDFLAGADVPLAAPNDVSSGRAEEIIRQQLRANYVTAVRDGWSVTLHADDVAKCTHLVVRHGAQRDEDNTWATWLGALRSTSWSGAHWLPFLPPIAASWRATGIASVCDAGLAGRVRYELYAANDQGTR